MHIGYSGDNIAFDFNCTVRRKKKTLPKSSVAKEFPQKPTATYSLRDLHKYNGKAKDKTITKYSSRLATVNDQHKKIFMRLSLNLWHPKELLCDFFFYLDSICMSINIIIWNLVGTCMKKTSEYMHPFLLALTKWANWC